MQDPLDSTGWVVRSDGGEPRFTGTCFGFRCSGMMLTAQHVVKDMKESDLSVTINLDEIEEGIEVRRVIRHPSADVAVLLIDDAIKVFDLFADVAPIPKMGDDVTAFGYPEDTAPGGPQPTPRLFKGHVQRRYVHRSHLGFEYAAAELSFGAPAGLSGGPVAHASLSSYAMGLVAENHESSTVLRSATDVVDNEMKYREEVRTMINYATCVLLHPIRGLARRQHPAMRTARRLPPSALATPGR